MDAAKQAEQIRTLRSTTGWTTKYIAEQLGLPISLIRGVLSGTKPPKPDALVKQSEIFTRWQAGERMLDLALSLNKTRGRVSQVISGYMGHLEMDPLQQAEAKAIARKQYKARVAAAEAYDGTED